MSKEYVVDDDNDVVFVIAMAFCANETYFPNAELKMVLLVLFPK